MLNSKSRAKLRSMANTITPIVQVGKGGVGPELCESVEAALESRELVKLSVLETAQVGAKEAAEEISQVTDSEVVGVIGRKIILYRMSSKPENRKISPLLK